MQAILSQHAEEASFLWLLRDAAVRAPHYLLADLVRLDDRIDAHIDGLRVNDEPAWAMCRDALSHEQEGEVFPAGVLAFEKGDPNRIGAVLDVVVKKPALARAAASALGWLSWQGAEAHSSRLFASENSVFRHIGLAAAVAQRKLSLEILKKCLTTSDSPLLGRALRAVGELGAIDLRGEVRKNLKHHDPSCRFWAAWTGSLFGGDGDSLLALQSFAETPGPHRARAINLASRRLQPNGSMRWLRNLADHGQQRIAILGAGAVGDPEMIPWLISRMNEPPLARVAGEALSMITGVHIAYDKLEGPKPEGFEAGPTEDSTDPNVAMDADEHLSWPRQDAVEAWWERNAPRFSVGTRYLAGKPATKASLQHVLRDGYQRQRAAAALELALLEPGSVLFEVRAPGIRQQKLLGQPR